MFKPERRARARPGEASSALQLCSDIRGNLTVLLALVFTALLGFVGLAIDAASWYSTKRYMQTAVDAAAMAAAYELSRASASLADAKLAAGQAARRNGFANGLEIDFRGNGSVVGASLSVEAPTYLSGLFLNAPPTLRASAAARTTRASICLHALEPESAGALDLVLASNITSPECRIQINSTSDAALRMTGFPTVRALSICVSGGVEGSLGYVSPSPDTGCPPVPDPLASLAPPPFHGCDHVGKIVAVTGATLSPGVYCGGITVLSPLVGKLTFQPGIYILKDGGLNLLNASATGNGVAFYLTGKKSTINAAGLGSLRLTAPASGPLAGIIFYQDRTTPPGTNHLFSIAVKKHYEGTIYLPTGDVTFLGASSGVTTSPYSIYIARRFALVGAGNLTIRESYDESTVPLPPGLDTSRTVALVE